MKAESLQRQNILEWKKEKCLVKAQIQQILKRSVKQLQSARKSTNPTRTVHNPNMDNSIVITKTEETTSVGCEETDAVKPPILDSDDISSENKNESLVLSTKELTPKEVELPSDKENIKDTLDSSDKDIEKVWANIRKDLTVTKIEAVIETNEKIKEEEIKNIPIEKLEPPEEEEPSDWEDQEAQSDAENDPVDESAIEPKDNVSGECVLILSDEEVEENEKTVPPKPDDLPTEANIDVSACTLTTSAEVQEKNIPLENKSYSTNDDMSRMEETLCNEDASNSKSEGLECSELNEHMESESAQSPKSHDSNHSVEDPADQQEEGTVDSADSANSVSSNDEKEKMPNPSEKLKDSTKITIKRNLSSGDEQYELKKPKLDENLELNNGDNCHTAENGTDGDVETRETEKEKPSILTHKALEEMIAQEICEYMVEGSKSYLVNCKKKCKELENLMDTYKRKVEQLQKEVNELRKEQKKLLSVKARNQGSLLKKGTRTVGISVRLTQDVLTRTVGTNVNLPQRLIERLSKSISPKPIPKIIQRSDSTTVSSQTSTTSTTTTTQEKAPVPMQLIANTAKGPTKVTITSTSSITTKPLNSSISIIDLTREDGESANPVSTTTTGGSLASLSGGSVIVSSTPVTRTINIGTPSNQTGGVVAVPLVYTTIPSGMPLLPSVPNASSSTTIRTSQTPTAIVPPTLNHTTPRITYLLPQATASLPINTTRAATPSTIATNTRPPMQAIFLRMSPPVNPSTSSSRFPVQSAVPVSLPSTISVVPVSRSSATSTTLPQRPQMQTVMVSSIPVSGNLLSGNNTTITTTAADTNQLTSSSKTSILTKPTVLTTSGSQSTVMISCVSKHPAPLPSHPPNPENPHFKTLPPKPALKISRVSNGIVLSWNMILNSSHAEVSTYQLFAYQEGNGPPNTSLWKKVGDVKALPLPMACTLTQFVEGHTYHFAVRAVDIHTRLGPFSDPTSIVLVFKHGVSK